MYVWRRVYRIALIFRRSKFLGIAVFENFIEIILRMVPNSRISQN